MKHTVKRPKAREAGTIGLILVISALFSPLWIMAQGPGDVIKEGSTQIQKHYQGEVDLGICLNLLYPMASYGELRTVQGYRFLPHLFAGVGIGFQFGGPWLALPLSLNAKYFIKPKAKVNPFITADVGWNIPVGMNGPFLSIGGGLRYRKFQCSLTLRPVYLVNRNTKPEYDGVGIGFNAGIWF